MKKTRKVLGVLYNHSKLGHEAKVLLAFVAVAVLVSSLPYAANANSLLTVPEYWLSANTPTVNQKESGPVVGNERTLESESDGGRASGSFQLAPTPTVSSTVIKQIYESGAAYSQTVYSGAFLAYYFIISDIGNPTPQDVPISITSLIDLSATRLALFNARDIESYAQISLLSQDQTSVLLSHEAFLNSYDETLNLYLNGVITQSNNLLTMSYSETYSDSLIIQSNTEYIINLRTATTSDGGSASALADPSIEIAASFPGGTPFNSAGFELLMSEGVGNTPPDHSPVPEPATMLLFGTGLAGLAAARRRKKSC